MFDGDTISLYRGGFAGRFRYSDSGDLLGHSERRFGCFKMIFVLVLAALVVCLIFFVIFGHVSHV